MRVSVVIPTYNRARLLQRALASVITQTHESLEIIVVDDGSTDHTRDVVMAVADPRLVYIRQPARSGASAARNTGLRAAQGQYVAFLDSDDEWFPTKVKRQLEVFNRSPSTTALVYTGAVYVHSHMGERVRTPRYRGRVMRRLLRRNFVVGSTSASIVRRDVLNEIGGFDETLDALQDFDLWVRIARLYCFDFVAETLVRIHMHDGTDRISSHLKRKLPARQAFYAKHRDLFEAEGLAHLYHIKTAQIYLRSLGDRRESRRFSRCAIQTKPSSLFGYFSYALSFVPDFMFSGFSALRRGVRRFRGDIQRSSNASKAL